jgi:hypothetical protein
MEQRILGKYARSFGWSLVISSVANALLVVAKEMNEPLKSWMKAATGHHWTTHSVLVLALFLVLGLALAAVQSPGGTRLGANGLAVAIFASTGASVAIIAGLFLLRL